MNRETFLAIDKAVKTTLRRMRLGWDEDAYQDGWMKALMMLRNYRPIPGNKEALLINYLNRGLGLEIARQLRKRKRPLCYYKKDTEIVAVGMEKAPCLSFDQTESILTYIDLKIKLGKLDEFYSGMIFDCLCGEYTCAVARKNSITRSSLRREIANMSSDDVA